LYFSEAHLFYTLVRWLSSWVVYRARFLGQFILTTQMVATRLYLGSLPGSLGC